MKLYKTMLAVFTDAVAGGRAWVTATTVEHHRVETSRNDPSSALLDCPVPIRNLGLVLVDQDKARDREYARQSTAIKDNAKELARLLSASPGRESDILRQEAANTNDRTLLIPIAECTHASADLLETLSRSTDSGVRLETLAAELYEPAGDSATHRKAK